MVILTIIFAAPLALLFILAARDGIKVWKDLRLKRKETEEVLFDDETPWYERDDQNDAKKSS